jgi:esterase/lipase superfamily enzyme
MGSLLARRFYLAGPRQAGSKSYAYDLDSARFAVDHLAAFIRVIIEKTNAKHVHVVAHSMGNWPTLAALEHVAKSPKKEKLGQVVLAAPDVDAEEFTRMVGKVLPVTNGLTLYVSSGDAAMMASRKLRKDTYRAGDVPPQGPIVMRGMDTIDVTLIGTDVFSLAHSEYAERRELLNDMALLFRKGERPPNSRTPILQTVKLQDKQYWRFPAN